MKLPAQYQTPFVLSFCLTGALALIVMLAVFIARQAQAARVPVNRLGGAGFASKYSSVIPLSWDPDVAVYNITFMVGNNQITAVWDSGSADLVIATDSCTSCGGAPYYPSQSSTSVALINEAAAGDGDSLCQTVKTYGSQRDTVQMYSDTVNIPRAFATPCSAVPVTAAGEEGPKPIIINSFPIGGVVANTGATSANVFGMSGVMCVTQQDGKYVLPSCQLTDTPQFISSLLATYALEAEKGAKPLLWSIHFAKDRDDGALVAFESRPPTCGTAVAYTPAVATLSDSTSDFIRVPWRYYVIEVERATSYDGRIVYDKFPRFLLVDTGTSAFMVPSGTTAKTLNTHGLLLNLAHANGAALSWSASVKDTRDGSPMFENMSESVATQFSKSHSVGIMGCLAMRGRYIEFTFGTPRMIGFA